MAIILDLLRDTIVGTNNNDLITSLLGDDVIHALGGNDTVKAGDGNDTVYGGDGNDRLEGALGNDILVGGTGDDILIGGSGADTFVFAPVDGPTGNDTITDFEAGTDTLDLTGTGITAGDFSDPGIFTHNAGTNTLTIDLGNGNSIVLNGIDAAEFAAIADSVVFDPDSCEDITATAAAEVFALEEDGCLTITGFALGAVNPDMLDLSAFGITALGMGLVAEALFPSEVELPNVSLIEPPNDILHWIAFNMEFNGFPNEDGVLDNNDIEVFRDMTLASGLLDTQQKVDAFNQAIDAFLTYDFDIGPLDENATEIVLTVTRDADGSEAGHLTLLGVGGAEDLLDLFDNHVV